MRDIVGYPAERCYQLLVAVEHGVEAHSELVEIVSAAPERHPNAEVPTHHCPSRPADRLEPVTADPDARYDREVVVDVDGMTAQVAQPPSPDNVVDVTEIEPGVRVDQVYVGNCANGTISDLRQLAAMLQSAEPAYAREELEAAARDFDTAYEAYNEHQRALERYWCLKYILQEGLSETGATVIRDDLVRIDGMPLVVRVLGLPAGTSSNERVRVVFGEVDLWETHVPTRYAGK